MMFQRVDLNLSRIPVARVQEVGSRAETTYATASDVAALQSQIDALDARIDALETWKAAAIITLADHESRITALEP